MEAYEAPEITEVGTIEELTQGGSAGLAIDDTFPAFTPQADLTFSNP